MARFLDTSGISHHLSEIIKNTDARLLIISPYLRFNRLIKEQLERQRLVLRKEVCVVYGKSELRPEESDWLAKTGIRTNLREHLHAKCYMNEKQALITSMNLYEFSQQNNDEMGILVSAEEDPELFRDIKEDAERILQASKEVTISVTQVGDAMMTTVPQTNRMPLYAFAPNPRLRCRKPDSACGAALRFHATQRGRTATRITELGRKFKDDSYEEKHCHTCGKDHSSSMAKPLCLSCFRKHRSVLSVAG